MTRHINLMQADMLPGYGPGQLPTYLVTLALTLVACVLYAGYHWTIQRSLEADIEQWQSRVETSANQLRTFRQNHPAMASEAELMHENQELAEQLAQREATFSGLTSQLGTAAQGFSQPLASLSDYDIDGVWLSRIVLRDSREHLSLDGFARRPEMIPQYLDQLEGTVFDGLTIQNLTIQQADTQSLWRFSLSDRFETESPAPLWGDL